MIGKALQWLGLDGMAHIIVSTVLLLVLQIFLQWWVCISATLLIGVAKEVIYDLWMRKGTPQWKDILCDFIGLLIGSLAFINL